MKKDFAPTVLDVRAFAQAEGRLSGSTAVSALPRLAGDLPPEAAASAAPVEWSAQGEARPVQGAAEQIWLSLQASARLPMVCQRCLQPVDVGVEVDRVFRFVADERTAEAEDDEAEEDLLVLDRAFDLMGLLEDELLMALPLVPSHEVCPAGGAQALSVAAGDPVFEEKPNPFAALQGLRLNKTK
ncbi:MAG: DUF177 domain-containing protein [Burkholderiales bacterium]|nr:DUF177 domain-containing protein [Burkholderiales bacterium]